MEKVRYEGADGIRGLACLIVLCTHIPGFFIPELAKYFSGTGKFGVWLFFVLSAFLLTSKFLQIGFSASEIMKYALGRFLRIIPLFLLVLLLYLSSGVLIHSYDDLVDAALFQKGYGHLWTIPVEFKFYAALPVFAFLFSVAQKRGGNIGSFMLLIMISISHQAMWPFWRMEANSIDAHWYIPCFLIGSYAAVSMGLFRKFATPAKATVVSVLVLISLLVLSPGGRNMLFGMPFDGWLQNKFLILGPIWGVFLVFLADGKGLVGSVLKSRPFTLMGAWSYSIYLIHWLVYSTFSIGNQGSWPWVAASFVCAITSGAILYYLVESPIERYRHSLLRPVSTKAAMST